MQEKSVFASDLLASLVVFLVALPLCMGIAIASGVPPAAGLITGIIGGLVVGGLSGCPLQVSGPAAGLTVLVFQIIQEHGIVMLGPIVLLAGVLQITAGLLRAGQLFRAISPAVIYGMLAGIGILIFAAQFHVMVDHTPQASGIANLLAFPESIALLFRDTDHDHHMAAIVGFVTLAVMLAWTFFARGFLRNVPGALVAVIAGTGTAQILHLNIHYVKLPASLLDAVTFTSLGGLTGLLRGELIAEACALAFIASAETLLSAAAVDQMARSDRKANYDRELFSQGVGNTLCGFFGSLPMTGVIVRSAANVNAGAKTRLSAILHGVWLLLVVVATPWLLQLVPTASLAGILVFTGIKLVDMKALRHLRQYGWHVVGIAVITTFSIVCFSLLTGIIIGLVLSVVKLLWAMSRLKVRVEERPENNRVDIYLEGSASFIGLPTLSDALDAVPTNKEAVVHIRGLSYVDHACMEALSTWERTRVEKGSPVYVQWDELMSFYNEKNTMTRDPKLQTASN